MELKRDEIISEIDTKIKYAKFVNTDAVILSSKAAQFCLEFAQFYEQKIKELTEENERLKACVMSEEQVRVIAKATIEDGISTIRADTVRKMQSEIKKTLSAICKGEMDDLFRIIDQIAKEMVGGENEN